MAMKSSSSKNHKPRDADTIVIPFGAKENLLLQSLSVDVTNTIKPAASASDSSMNPTTERKECIQWDSIEDFCRASPTSVMVTSTLSRGSRKDEENRTFHDHNGQNNHDSTVDKVRCDDDNNGFQERRTEAFKNAETAKLTNDAGRKHVSANESTQEAGESTWKVTRNGTVNEIRTPDNSEETEDDDTTENDDDTLTSTVKSDEKSNRILAKQKKLHLALQQEKMKRAKMVTFIQSNKSSINQLQREKDALQATLNEVKAQLSKTTDENSRLRAGLDTMAASRDEVKSKLRLKNELFKEIRNERDDIERQLKRSGQERLIEQKLLQQYRMLAQHTGYYRWGKEIRLHESELAAAMSASRD